MNKQKNMDGKLVHNYTFTAPCRIIGPYGEIPKGAKCQAIKYDDSEYPYRITSDDFLYDEDFEDEGDPYIWCNAKDFRYYRYSQE